MLHLLKGSREELAKYIKEQNKKIVVYGAGMIGKVIIPDYLLQYDIIDNLQFYVDMDVRKQQKGIEVQGQHYEVCSKDGLLKMPKDSILLVTNSNYNPVLKMLDEMEGLDGREAILFPVIEAEEAGQVEKEEFPWKEITSNKQIPKKIHYCWFSGKEIPDYLKKCMESWHRFCPDYEIIRWDESNYDINKNLYMSQAYKAQKWGFVPDYARLDILYEQGGFYLDTDVELIKSLDELRNQGAFCGVEKWGNINMGGCSGAVPHHPMIGKILETRKNLVFCYPDGTLNMETCGVYETQPFLGLGMHTDNTTQRINGMTVFSSAYFHPYDYMSGEAVLTDRTISIHHFNGGWLDESARKAREKTTLEYRKVRSRMEQEYVW